MTRLSVLVPVLLACSAPAQMAFAQQGEAAGGAQSAPASRQALFGDLHLHTAFSFDAIASGTQTTPIDAYLYALGEPVEYMGRTVQRQRPLDFLAVTDHAEYLGIPYEASRAEGMLAGSSWAQQIAAVEEDTLAYMRLFSGSAFRGTEEPINELLSGRLILSLWQRQIDIAERFYNPGEFTTLVGYEWSPMPGGAHLHRNVIFRGPAYPSFPFSALDSSAPEDLWTHVETLRRRGVDSVLIPHNPNLSQGLMFASSDSYGEPITREYAQRRLANERLVEITQIKGTSETLPGVGAPDEFAGFEILRLDSEADADPTGGYLRPALGRGLEIEAATGVNPFRFGFVGSSDFHSGTSATEEDNFTGALGRADDIANPEMVLTEINPITNTPATVFSASGLTGVWAETNTRESIFAALKRREAFATSGTHIRVRLFAGWELGDDLFASDRGIEGAYSDGFPMGADITPQQGNSVEPLRLAVQALKDPLGANLDRVQIIKVWLENGVAQEAIHEVAWSDGRTPDPATGQLPAVGNSVDLATASYDNTIGAASLTAVWTDEDFDADVPAIYYARVLEIPTPRWSTYLAVANGMPVSGDVPATIQERAWTSPVFYTPVP